MHKCTKKTTHIDTTETGSLEVYSGITEKILKNERQVSSGRIFTKLARFKFASHFRLISKNTCSDQSYLGPQCTLVEIDPLNIPQKYVPR